MSDRTKRRVLYLVYGACTLGVLGLVWYAGAVNASL